MKMYSFIPLPDKVFTKKRIYFLRRNISISIDKSNIVFCRGIIISRVFTQAANGRGFESALAGFSVSFSTSFSFKTFIFHFFVSNRVITCASKSFEFKFSSLIFSSSAVVSSFFKMKFLSTLAISSMTSFRISLFL